MENYVIGIDPGLKGGIIALYMTGEICAVSLMPDSPDRLAEILRCQQYCKHVFLEKAQAMPGQGVSSMFNYGVGFGTIIGILSAHELPYTLVPPQTWTKAMHIGTTAGKPKERSLEACRRLCPNLDLLPGKCKKPHEGIIDAYLIAEWGRRQLGGGCVPPPKA